MIQLSYSLPWAQIAGWCAIVGTVMLSVGLVYWIILTYPPREEP